MVLSTDGAGDSVPFKSSSVGNPVDCVVFEKVDVGLSVFMLSWSVGEDCDVGDVGVKVTGFSIVGAAGPIAAVTAGDGPEDETVVCDEVGCAVGGAVGYAVG